MINKELKLNLPSIKNEKQVNENKNATDIHIVKRQRSLTEENVEL